MSHDEQHLQRLVFHYKEAFEERKDRLSPAARDVFFRYIIETLNKLRFHARDPYLLKACVNQCIIDTQMMLYFLKTSA